MKQVIRLVLPVILVALLQLHNAYGVSETHLAKECLVKDEEIFSLSETNSFNVLFFVTAERPITIHVFFEGFKKHEDNDLLIIKPNSVKIQRKRGGNANTYDDTLHTSLRNGWNNITITLEENKLNIGDIYSLTGFEYLIKEISFTGKCFTNCCNNTPIWEIDNSTTISIPLTGLSKFGIKLFSDQPFRPRISLNYLDIPLSYTDEVLIKNSSLPLQQMDYIMKVKQIENTVTISITSKAYEESELYMRVTMKESLVYLNATSHEGAFFVLLDPDYKNYPELEDTIDKLSTKEPVTQGSTNTLKINEKKCAASCTEWKITTGLASVISILLSVISIYLYKKIYKTQTIKEDETEDGETNIPLLNQVPIKHTIKSTCTETHGESNILTDPHAKEICKIKFKGDKKSYKKETPGTEDTSKSTKVILVVGQTGSGKSSFINAMTNFIYGVEYDDPFRFKLVDDMDGIDTSGYNNTEEIVSYHIPFMCGIKHNCNYIFIDTPGFGDSRGFGEDKKLNHKFYEFLQNNPDISQVDGICFIIKVTDTRLTMTQSYIIDGLFSMFGKDIENNVFAVVSYSDGSKSHAPTLLEGSGLHYNLAINFNSNGIYNDKEITSDSSVEVQNYFKKNWKLNMKSMEGLFKKLMTTTAVSLFLTNIVLEETKDIERLKDELLELRVKENAATDQEIKDIQTSIKENQELLMTKLDEAHKLFGRLEYIPAKKNPLVINEYIDMLIKSEKNQEKILELQKLKDRNTDFQNIMKGKRSTKSLFNYIFGDKTEKTD